MRLRQLEKANLASQRASNSNFSQC